MDLDQSCISRIHGFRLNFEDLRARLKALNKKHPCGVIIPVLGKDLSQPSLRQTIEGLNKCDYLRKVYIALSAGGVAEYEDATRLCEAFEVQCDIAWCNSPAVTRVLDELKCRGLDLTVFSGKGRDLWLTMGIASLELYAFALHDADIASYSELLPTKLLYAIVEPRLDFFFSKGYYARINLERGRIYGRVCRLFINPLLDALSEKLHYKSPLVRYLDAFRYALSGEVALYSDLALNLRVPSDWGLEVGMLAEIYRNVSVKRVCEVDLGFFEHRHKSVVKDELIKTAEDSFVTLLRTLTETEGIDVSQNFLLSLSVIYQRFAQDRIRQYHADALCNSLEYDRHEEETYVEAFVQALIEAGNRYIQNPTANQLPDWLRVLSAMPDAREKLRDAAVELKA